MVAVGVVRLIWSLVGTARQKEVWGSWGGAGGHRLRHSRTAAGVCQQKKDKKNIRTNEIQWSWPEGRGRGS